MEQMLYLQTKGEVPVLSTLTWQNDYVMLVFVQFDCGALGNLYWSIFITILEKKHKRSTIFFPNNSPVLQWAWALILDSSIVICIKIAMLPFLGKTQFHFHG